MIYLYLYINVNTCYILVYSCVVAVTTIIRGPCTIVVASLARIANTFCNYHTAQVVADIQVSVSMVI